MRGIRAQIEVGRYGNCSNGGLSSRCAEVTIVATITKRIPTSPVVEELPEAMRLVEATEDAPAVAIVWRSGGMCGALPACAVPVEVGSAGVTEVRAGVGPAMGGCAVTSPDPRFRVIARGAETVDLHDRFETVDEYASYD